MRKHDSAQESDLCITPTDWCCYSSVFSISTLFRFPCFFTSGLSHHTLPIRSCVTKQVITMLKQRLMSQLHLGFNQKQAAETTVSKQTAERCARAAQICICPHTPPRQAVNCVCLFECYSPELLPPAAHLYPHGELSPAEVIFIRLDIYPYSLCLWCVSLQMLEQQLDWGQQLIHKQEMKKQKF